MGAAFGRAFLFAFLTNRRLQAPYNPRAFCKLVAIMRWMMRRTHPVRVFRTVPLVLALLAAGPSLATAQSTATLQGTITDTQSAVMPGVSIAVRNVATGMERSALTDSAGQYVTASLPPGHYTVVAHLEGFQDQTREVDLGVAQTVLVNMR